MVQIPSWEANCFAASQEIPRISQNPKVHYRTHKCPPPVSILGQPTPVYIPTSHLLEIHPNIIHPSTPRSPEWSPSLWFPHQDPIHPPLLTHTRHMPSPSHSSWTKSIIERLYGDTRGRIFNLQNRFLHKTQLLKIYHDSSYPFCILNVFILWGEFSPKGKP